MMYLLIFSLIIGFGYYFVENTKALHMLQQNWYNEGNRYVKWIKNNPKKVFIDFDLFFVLFILFIFMERSWTVPYEKIFNGTSIRFM